MYQFLIPLRNAKTGAEKNFYDKQQIADFLASVEDAADWEGHAALGALPEPTPASVAESGEDEMVDPAATVPPEDEPVPPAEATGHDETPETPLDPLE